MIKRSNAGMLKGYGVSNSWMWLDYDKLGRALRDSGCNCTHIDVFGCGPTKDTWPTKAIDEKRGYWMYRFNEVRPRLIGFVKSMHDYGIVVLAHMTGWNFRNGAISPTTGTNASICCPEFDYNWFGTILSAFIEAGNIGSTALCASSEAGGKNRECIGKFDLWTKTLDEAWNGVRLWSNGMGVTAPPGYITEHHPQNQKDIGPAGCLILTDGPAHDLLLKDKKNPYTSALNPAAARWAAREVNKSGRHFCSYGMRFNEGMTGLDMDAITAIGGA